MIDAIAIAVLASVLFGLFKLARTRKRAQRDRARTITLAITDHEARRVLADGREEAARWTEVVSVEVVCTPVKTADGAKSFLLLAEGAEQGCLVPLGVGYDDDLVQQLARLPRFRLDLFTAATEHKAPRRTMVWERTAPQGQPDSPGSSESGTGSNA